MSDAQKPLTSAQRTCLIKVARERLQQLHDEYESSAEHGHIGSQREHLATEIACVDSAIRWLWQHNPVSE